MCVVNQGNRSCASHPEAVDLRVVNINRNSNIQYADAPDLLRKPPYGDEAAVMTPSDILEPASDSGISTYESGYLHWVESG